MSGPFITLTTDFAEDFFAGVIRGVIARINGDARVVDLTHAVSPGDLRAGAFALLAGCRWFPRGTVHVVVVDPGVGSGRKILCASTDDYCFIAPDNGILSWALTREKNVTIYSVEERRFFLEPVSATFHARDIFAPAAAHLTLGVRPEALGPALTRDRIVWIDFPEPVTGDKGELRGEVLYIDRFGNCITNLPAARVAELDPATLRIETGSLRLAGLRRSYADEPEGTALALVGSAGFLEIATSMGSVAERFRLEVGDPVTLSVARD